MKALADYIHSKGLKAGLYSSPGPYTCGGCTGSWLHELQDAKSYAAWGYDYLKYDWCSYTGVQSGEGHDKYRRPYFLMGRFLAMQPRGLSHASGTFATTPGGFHSTPTACRRAARPPVRAPAATDRGSNMIARLHVAGSIASYVS